jgi:hypothetical protein
MADLRDVLVDYRPFPAYPKYATTCGLRPVLLTREKDGHRVLVEDTLPRGCPYSYRYVRLRFTFSLPW